MKRLTVCLDARLVPGTAGGVEQALLGLMRALGSSGSGHRYRFLVRPEAVVAFAPFAIGASELMPVVRPAPAPPPPPAPGWGAQLRRRMRRLLLRPGAPPAVPTIAEPAKVTRLDPDLLHFPFQACWPTRRRNIFQPWDLQHRHLPQFFTEASLRRREEHYRAGCAQATRVVVASEWVRQDLIAAYGLPGERICVVPMAAPTDAYPQLAPGEAEAELAALGLAPPYAFYPAQSWPHKNHVLLVQALARLRAAGGPDIPLVCCGRRTAHFAVVEAEAHRLGVAPPRHLGYVDARRLVALYHGARLLAFPSLCEGWGLPLTEAMSLGVPIAAARTTCIPEQLGDAGILFAPTADAAADALHRLWTDEALRRECIARGRARAASFTWTATADAFNRLYEELAG